MMEFTTWLPLVVAFLASMVSLVLTLRGNARAKRAQAVLVARLEQEASVAHEQAMKIRQELKRLEREAAAVSAETRSSKERDVAAQLAKIAAELEEQTAELEKERKSTQAE